eukprot:3590929-Alexandrium_andersonii.AAC.1
MAHVYQGRWLPETASAGLPGRQARLQRGSSCRFGQESAGMPTRWGRSDGQGDVYSCSLAGMVPLKCGTNKKQGSEPNRTVDSQRRST